MPNTFEGTLANIPGYGGYLAKRKYDEQSQLSDIAQATHAMSLVDMLRKQQQAQAYQQDLTGLGQNPTPEAMAAVGARYSGPEGLMKAQEAKQAHEATVAATKEAIAGRLQNAALQIQMLTKHYDDQRNNATLSLEERTRANKKHEELTLSGQKIAQQLADTKKESSGMSKVPSGYRSTQEGNLEAIPGGPADTKLQGVLNQDTAMLQGTTADLDRLASEANKLLNHPGLSGITGAVGKIPNIPGSKAADARATLDAMKSQVAFSVLQTMRNNSKTGGALGQVSDAEGKLLQNNLAALDTTQSTDALKSSLKQIIEYTNNAKDRLHSAYNLKHGEKQTITSPSQPAVIYPTATNAEGKKIQFKDGQWQPIP